jgi:ABC-type Fe3+/spermidine/putrescine transport system ATPase subunit
MTVIEFKSVTKKYGDTEVLDNLSIKTDRGERVVILGPSGCGKTTILRLIAGFSAPDAGTITINGQMVAADGRILVQPEKRNIGMVFQDLALWPHLTVRGNIEFGLKAKKMEKNIRRDKIRRILTLVGLENSAEKKPAQLSGGQQQRAALARALVLEPEILLMDEPLSSLDAELNRRLRNEIVRLHQKLGFTLLYVTHSRKEALDIATRIIILQEGKKIFTGKAARAQEYLLSEFPDFS